MTAFDPAALGLRAAAGPSRPEPRDTIDQQDFLTLLVTQLRNQDPLNPLDNETFVAQLAQFSTVSGINETNAKLDRLAELAGSDARAGAPQWLGRAVEAADGRAGRVVEVGFGEGGALTLALDSGASLAPADVRRIA